MFMSHFQNFPLDYFTRLLKFDKFSKEISESNLLSHLIRNMDKVVITEPFSNLGY